MRRTLTKHEIDLLKAASGYKEEITLSRDDFDSLVGMAEQVASKRLVTVHNEQDYGNNRVYYSE